MLADPAQVPRVYWSLGLVPVQTWIAEARRSRDLLAGSRILAWMMGCLLGVLRDADATILLPRLEPSDLQSLQGSLEQAISVGSTAVSNRASGWLPTRPKGAASLLRSLETRLEEHWAELAHEVSAAADRSAHDLWKEVRGEVGHPPCPFQLVWAALETSGSDEEGLREVDRLYTAVKRSRAIRAHRGSPVRKCGQCARREAMGGPDPVQWRDFQKRLSQIDEVERGLRIDAGEYLCPQCALRRFAGYLSNDPFPSTSAIAARDWLYLVRSVEDLRSLLASLEAVARQVPGYEAPWVDRAPLFYERSIHRELRYGRSRGDTAQVQGLEDVLEKRLALAAAINRHKRDNKCAGVPSDPSEYLAVLMFDGDDMGRRLRQDLETLPGSIREFQNALAGRLGGEGEDPFGLAEPFYLGGDEGLVLVPVGAALNLATAIRDFWSEGFGEPGGGAPTLSMGLTLFDRERPLGAAIETARQSLEAAKRLDGKDAMSVSVQTASGSVWSVTGRWGREWKRLEAAVNLISERRIGEPRLATGWPHDVGSFLRSLPGEAFTAGDTVRRAIAEEVKRLTYRRVDRGGGDARSTDQDREEVWHQLGGETWFREEPPQEVLEGLAEQLHLVAFLARHALVPPPGAPGVPALAGG